MEKYTIVSGHTRSLIDFLLMNGMGFDELIDLNDDKLEELVKEKAKPFVDAMSIANVEVPQHIKNNEKANIDKWKRKI